MHSVGTIAFKSGRRTQGPHLGTQRTFPKLATVSQSSALVVDGAVFPCSPGCLDFPLYFRSWLLIAFLANVKEGEAPETSLFPQNGRFFNGFVSDFLWTTSRSDATKQARPNSSHNNLGRVGTNQYFVALLNL